MHKLKEILRGKFFDVMFQGKCHEKGIINKDLSSQCSLDEATRNQGFQGT